MPAPPQSKPMTIGGVKINVHPGVHKPYYVSIDDLLYKLPDLAQCKCVMDMGTGTGILPLLWAENFPGIANIVAVDVNPAAIANARENITNYPPKNKATTITLLQSNLFEALENGSTTVRKLTGGSFDKFDAIVFNGPHVDLGDAEKNKALSGKIGQAVTTDLCDFDLRVATNFFERAGKYLDKDGFIIYTFSDYCRIERLFKVIANSKTHYMATLLSVMEFKSEKLDELQPPTEKVHLWYNLKIKHRDRMDLSEMTRGFRKAIVTVAGRYMDKKKADTAHITEHREKTKSLLRCLTAQVDQLIGPDEWLVSGYSLPNWNKKQPEHMLLYSFGSALKSQREDLEMAAKDGPDKVRKDTLDARLERLVNFMRGRQGFVLIIDYLAKPGSLKMIEAVRGLRTKIDYLKGQEKLSYEFDAEKLQLPSDSFGRPSPTSFARPGPTDAQQHEIQALSSEIDRDIRSSESYRQITDEKLMVASLEIGRNLWLNFSAIRVEGTEKKLRYIKFLKVNYPMTRLSGSVYFFSALEPTQRNNDLLAALEELFGIANDNLLSPIWITIRHEYALRSAIAAIMSRNMSHNLGSHVLWHLSQKLEHKADEVEREP